MDGGGGGGRGGGREGDTVLLQLKSMNLKYNIVRRMIYLFDKFPFDTIYDNKE